MQDQALNEISTSVPREAVKPAITMITGGAQSRNNVCQGESDADFALLLLDIVKDVIRENADRFLVRPTAVPAVSAVPPDVLAELATEDQLEREFNDRLAAASRFNHNRPRAFGDQTAAQEIEWKRDYGDRQAYYSTRQLAQLTRRSISRVRKWVKEGKINAVRFGGVAPQGQIFIPKDQLGRLKAMGIGKIL